MSRRGHPNAAARCWRISLAVLALTGAYLAIPARSRMDMTTAGVVLLHVGFGLLTIPALLVAMIGRARKGQTLPGCVRTTGVGLLAIGALTGAAMLIAAARGGVTS